MSRLFFEQGQCQCGGKRIPGASRINRVDVRWTGLCYRLTALLQLSAVGTKGCGYHRLGIFQLGYRQNFFP